jgi:hypothetical protein
MEDDLYFSGKGRRPQYFRKWKKTTIFEEIEDLDSLSADTKYNLLSYLY